MQVNQFNKTQQSTLLAELDITETISAIILAGGLGTRLRSAVSNVPKCMAPVNGKPFIGYVIDYFVGQGIKKFVLALGYMYDIIVDYVEKEYAELEVEYSIEHEPLGTGGAIKLACAKVTSENAVVTNGDTLFNADIVSIANFHKKNLAHCTLALKPMKNFDRYGVVNLDADGRVIKFSEKQFYNEGFINGGLYMLNAQIFLKESFPEKFSFEKDYLEKLYVQRQMFGVPQDCYFIDIGIPEDYQRVQNELK